MFFSFFFLFFKACHATIYFFFIGFSEISAFFTAVLLTPIALAASVKLVYSITSKVIRFLTITGTPIRDIAAADNLARVSSESFIPLRELDILFLSSSVKILPVAAKDRFFLFLHSLYDHF